MHALNGSPLFAGSFATATSCSRSRSCCCACSASRRGTERSTRSRTGARATARCTTGRSPARSAPTSTRRRSRRSWRRCRSLPWQLFVAIWTAILLAAYGWLFGSLALPALLFLPIPVDIATGNVHLLFAAAIVPGSATRPPGRCRSLTKVTPFIGVAVVRGPAGVAALAIALRRDGGDRRRLDRARSLRVAASGSTSSANSARRRHARLGPAGAAARPPADRGRRRAASPASRTGSGCCRSPCCSRCPSCGSTVRDPRRLLAAVAGARRPRRRGAGLRDRRARGRAHVSASVARPRSQRGSGAAGRSAGRSSTRPSCRASPSRAPCSSSRSCRSPCAATRTSGTTRTPTTRRPPSTTRTGPRSTAASTPSAGCTSTSTRRRSRRSSTRSACSASRGPRSSAAWTILLLASLALDGPTLDAAAPAVPARPRRAVAGQPQHPARARDRRRDALPGVVVVHPADEDHARASASSGSPCAANGGRSPSPSSPPWPSSASASSSPRGCGPTSSRRRGRRSTRRSTSRARRRRSRCRCGSSSRRCSSPGPAGRTGRGSCRSRPGSPCRSCGGTRSR